MAKDASLQLRPVQSTDIPALAVIQVAAFTGARAEVMYKNVSPTDKLAFIEEHIRRLCSASQSSAHPRVVHPLCVVDTLTDEIISYVVWVYLPKGYLASEDVETQFHWLPAGANEPLCRDFFKMTGELRSAYPGRREPHWLLCSLATNPKHEGRGAGSMLISWAFPKADEMGLKCYVDGSVVGYPVYQKRGFLRDVGNMELDLSKYEGGEGYEVQRWVAMMREPEGHAAQTTVS